MNIVKFVKQLALPILILLICITIYIVSNNLSLISIVKLFLIVLLTFLNLARTHNKREFIYKDGVAVDTKTFKLDNNSKINLSPIFSIYLGIICATLLLINDN